MLEGEGEVAVCECGEKISDSRDMLCISTLSMCGAFFHLKCANLCCAMPDSCGTECEKREKERERESTGHFPNTNHHNIQFNPKIYINKHITYNLT